jgi:hypothetical protein
MPQPRLARITANSRFKTAAEVAEHMAKLARDPQFKIVTPGMTRAEHRGARTQPKLQYQERNRRDLHAPGRRGTGPAQWCCQQNSRGPRLAIGCKDSR